MNLYFTAAAMLTIVVGLVHSVFGEVLIFRRMRQGGFIPTNGARLIGEGHVRIIWASWHVLSVLGWCLAAILLWLARQTPVQTSHVFLGQAISLAMLAGSLLVLVGTKGRHPGWAGLLGVSVLAWIGQNN